MKTQKDYWRKLYNPKDLELQHSHIYECFIFIQKNSELKNKMFSKPEKENLTW